MTQLHRIYSEMATESAATPLVTVPTQTDSFAAFYDAEYASIVRLAIALTGDRQAAEDIAGDVFLDAYRRWSKVGSYDQPEAWARRAVANRAASFRHRRMRWAGRLRRHRFRTTEDPAPLPDEQLWREVSQLPRRQAQMIVLHYVEQLTTNEAADLLGISQASAKTHLQRARDTLSQQLTNRTSS